MKASKQSEAKRKSSVTTRNDQSSEIVGKNEDNIREIVRNQQHFRSYPAGFRFCPKDGELIYHYINNKIRGKSLPLHRVMDVNISKYNPMSLAEIYPISGEKEMYFFTPRDRKYRNGDRPNRAAAGGYWKATGRDTVVTHNGEAVGFKKSLVFYLGRPPKGEKTNWIMQEFRTLLQFPKCEDRGANGMRLDDCVLCKVYVKKEKTKGSRKKNDENEDEEDREHNMVEEEERNQTCAFEGGLGFSGASNGYVNTHMNDRLTMPVNMYSTDASHVTTNPFVSMFRGHGHGHGHAQPMLHSYGPPPLSGHAQRMLPPHRQPKHGALPLSPMLGGGHLSNNGTHSSSLWSPMGGVEEEMWNNTYLDGLELAPLLNFSNIHSFPSLDNILSNNCSFAANLCDPVNARLL